jgi:hypothetical protein
MEKIIDTIRKLQRHAESAASFGSRAEAEAFAARAQKLLLDYKLTQEAVDAADFEGSEIMGGCVLRPSQFGQKRSKRRVAWTEDLAQTVAEGHFCRAACLPGSNKIVFLGRRHDVEIAVYVFCRLARTSAKTARLELRETKLEYKQDGLSHLWPGDKIFTDSFHLGFSAAILGRYKQQREQAEQVHAHALILHSEDAALKTFVSSFTNYHQARPLRRSEVEDTAMLQGFKAGNAVDLETPGLRGQREEKFLRGGKTG